MKYRFCKKDEIEEVMKFIHDNWKNDHILARNQTLMDWQYWNEKEGRYNFVLARDYGILVGVLGYIRCSDVIWLALWKSIGFAGTGIQMVRFVEDNEKYTYIGSIGIKEKVERIYEAMGYSCGVMDQFYVLPDISRGGSGIKSSRIKSLGPLSDDPILDKEGQSWKPEEYLNWRYKDHPLYDYWVCEFWDGTLILRMDVVPECRACRIVDWWGSPGNPQLHQYLINYFGVDHIDCYSAGVPDSEFEKAGFKKLDPLGDVIIPNYFAPYHHGNIEIRYCFKTDNLGKFKVVKSDGDMDRPS